MRGEVLPSERALLAGAALLAGGLLIAAFFAPGPVLTGWLAGAIAFGFVPSGALVLAMMMRLIRGVWGEDLRLFAEAATLLAPTSALAMLPVLVGMGPIYPWLHDRAELSPFQLAWLLPLQFVLVTAARFSAQYVLGRALRQGRVVVRAATIGLIIMPLLTSLAAVDWIMSLDTRQASSAFGLRFIVMEVTAAFCALVLQRLYVGRPPRRPGVLGALLLTLLLLSAYFLFLPFFIVWSSNLPENVGWYANRWTSGCQASVWAFALLGGLPIFPLLLSSVRRSRRWLTVLSLCVLAATAIELGWTVLPGRGALAIGAYVAALFSTVMALTAGLRLALRARIRARSPRRFS